MYKTFFYCFQIIGFSCFIAIFAIPATAQHFSIITDEIKLCGKGDKHKGADCPCRSLFGVTDICESKNEIDIRLSYIDSNQLVRLYVLTFDSQNKGQATLFIDSVFLGTAIRTNASPHFQHQLQPKIPFDSIYVMLSSKLFRKQETGSTPISGLTDNQIIYKNGKRIRKFYLPEPENWVALTRESKRKLNHYINIVHLFQDYFTMEN